MSESSQFSNSCPRCGAALPSVATKGLKTLRIRNIKDSNWDMDDSLTAFRMGRSQDDGREGPEEAASRTHAATVRAAPPEVLKSRLNPS